MVKKIFILFLFFFAFLFGLNAQTSKQYVKAGEQFVSNGMYQAAIEEFEKALLLDPADGKTYELLATTQLMTADTLMAAENFKRAGGLNYDPEVNFLQAANLYYQVSQKSEALTCINQGLIIKPKSFDLLIFKARLLYESEDYQQCYNIANEAKKAKDLALAYFYSGVSARFLGNYDEALQDLEKSVLRDKNLITSYLEIGEIHYIRQKYDYAVDNATVVLLLYDPENIRALLLRSKAFHAMHESDQALADITKAISFDKENAQLYILRGEMNNDYALYSNAIDDFTLALSFNDTIKEALYGRAVAFEQLDKKVESTGDYKRLLSLMPENTVDPEYRTQIEEKIFDLERESDKPIVTLDSPQVNDKLELEIKENTDEIVLKGRVAEPSGLSELKINNIVLNYTDSIPGEYTFETKLSLDNLDFVTIHASDIYGNNATVSYPITFVETDPPQIALISPLAEMNGAIYLEPGDNTLYIEGRVEDNSTISEIKIDEINASFAPDDYNPKFTATIDLNNRKSLNITAVDAYGNKTEQVFDFVRDGKLLSGSNPMGKTWVVIIENSDYKEYASLKNPAKESEGLIKALDRYQISKILLKRNMTKREMERFFAIDLRDLIVSNGVNSLLIWYTGHGRAMNNTGYWVPVDARLNDEYDLYNVNALKASLYSYTSLTHRLVVSDACEAGEAFTIAMRGDNTLANCNDAALVKEKSALVLTSTSDEAALDKSLFADTFINSLENNPASCIPVDAIAERISIVLLKQTAQKPSFGRISGLEDNGGTFFFILK